MSTISREGHTYWNWGQISLTELGAVRLNPVIWKSAWEPEKPFLLNRLNGNPAPWDANAYAELRGFMNSIPEGKMRDDAQERIARLDCTSKDKSLASCDPAAKPPDWQKKLARGNVDYAAYVKALATELRGLVCVEDVNAVYILRGMIKSKWFYRTGGEAPALVDFIMSKDCPLSASLTDDDKATLLEVKQVAEIVKKESAPPPPASKKEQ